MSNPWILIDNIAKDRTVDLWGFDCDPDPKKGGILLPRIARRWTDCFWGCPKYERPSGLIMHRDEAWWHHMHNDEYQRIWPTHYMEIPKGPNV